MLARRQLPEAYRRFNLRYGAPWGRHDLLTRLAHRAGGTVADRALTLAPVRRWRGPFAFQWNTRTRAFEYPWVHEQLDGQRVRGRRLRILEIGGALSGLQFALAVEGHQVTNVDPFLDFGDGGYLVDPAREHAALNAAFRTDVALHRTTLPEAALTGPFDAVVCVSTIEHLSRQDIADTLGTARQLLAPGGVVILTVDLFLDLVPFTDREANRWGTNVPIAWLGEVLGCGEPVAGRPSELYGYPGFSPGAVLAGLEDFAMGTDYPQLAQLVAYRAPS